MKETLMQRESIYMGSLINLYKDTVQCSNGVTSTREVVEHSPAVVVIPVTDQGQIVLVEQYRRAVDKCLLECPAGCVELDEDPLNAAKRELKEETGYVAHSWEYLHEGFPTPGFCDEIYYLYLAKGLSFDAKHLDEDEVVVSKLVSFLEFESLVKKGQITDIKTLLAYYILCHRRH